MLLVMTQEAQKLRTQSRSVVGSAPFVAGQWMNLEIYLDKDLKRMREDEGMGTKSL